MSDRHDLEIVLRSGTPIVVIETADETRFLSLLTQIAIGARKSEYRPLFRWSVTDGLQRLDLDLEPQRHVAEPEDVLRHIRALENPGIYALLDFHPFLENAVNTRLLKDIALAGTGKHSTVVLVSHRIDLPRELAGFSARFEMRLPDADGLRQLVARIIDDCQRSGAAQPIDVDAKAMDLLVRNLSGLDHADAERLARTAIVDDGALTVSDIPGVMQAKYRLLNQSGVLSFEYDTTSFREVAGFTNLKRWLLERRAAFGDCAPADLDPPKGFLLLGVQGCGKSLAAKAAASALGVPLLRLDFGALYNKYHGETERNLRETLATAEVMSPCVLWLDEVEKGVSLQNNDGGTSRRVLGSLLTWMAERKKPVLMVATANDIESLPPELIRKGRFDEIFFVDLPTREQRREVFAIHLTKRRLRPDSFDLERLVDASHGFSGAEIEQAIVAALYTAHARRQALATVHVFAEMERTRPLSVVMAERITALRAWAHGRTVPAD